MTINREATIRWKGYDPDELSYGSDKRIWINCDDCGIGRWRPKNGYRALCHNCSIKKRSEDIIWIEKQKEGSKRRSTLQSWIDNHKKGNKEKTEKPNWLQTRKKISVGRRGILLEDWDGFVGRDRPYLMPASECIQMNDWFVGYHGHHITKSIIAYIPTELHRHISHTLNTGRNMGEMNALAIQFINGGL